MACVILPSETARLVYGYLVKENFNDIATQFLESSPYLTDCCQVVKSGYQFNTKLMGKDLKEMLQEYSVIHNLVNNKVNLLCKTSLLYKKIKLRCESLPEILELILFWKSKNSKNEENSFKNDKYSNSLTVNTNSEYNANSEFKNISEVTSNRTNILNTSDNNSFHKNDKADLSQNNNESVSEDFQSKLNCETCPTEKEPQAITNDNDHLQENEMNGFQDDDMGEKSSEFVSNKISEIPNGSESNNTCGNNINSKNTPLTNSTLSNNTNVLSLDVNPQNDGVGVNEMNVSGILESNEEAIGFDSQIKIVRIEKDTQNEDGALNIFPKPVVETGGNVGVDNSSVVYVTPEVGNVTLNQDRNQIIVIPIDYYKSQNELERDVQVDNSQKPDLIQEKEVVTQEKGEVIFEGLSAPEAYAAAVTQLYSDDYSKTRSVDENIVTESDFLKNGHLMCNLEKELKKQPIKPQPIPQPQPLTYQDVNVNPTVHPVSAPLIVLSQAVVPENTKQYRTILPKSKPIKVPFFTVHPLVEKNKVLPKRNPVRTESKPKNSRKQPRRRAVARKNKVVQPENQNPNPETFNMPIIQTPSHDEMGGANSGQPTVETVTTEEPQKTVDIERTNEEKENLGKVAETKKTETPVFLTKRHLKRQSLSTPRRRSHIRALEFETPPKTNEEKKSRTSPKAKVEQVTVERKSVRNTLFKSPDAETSFKSPNPVKGDDKPRQVSTVQNCLNGIEPLSELSIPIATRSPNTKLSDAWEKLTGVGCVIGQNEIPVTTSPNKPLTTPPSKKMWDADLRHFIGENVKDTETCEKKRIRKVDKNQKDSRKASKKKGASTKKIKATPVTTSPKMSLTAKRNTYSINGNEEGSPLRSLLDDLKIVTPFKDIDAVRPTEETPLTKLLRENINTIDIDLSMINTPSFPPTPSIVITPDLEDAMTGTNYYSPTKDCTKDKVVKITDYFRVDTEKTSKQETREMHEKVIDDLVSKAKEIIGIGRDSQDENMTKGRPTGKILSMVKIQMLTQCDKKLCENIPINEESSFSNSFANQTTLMSNLSEEATKSDLKGELEEKRKRALSKIKVVKENLNNTRTRGIKRKRKRKGSGYSSKTDRSKSDLSNDTISEKQNSESDETPKRETEIFHSTPYSEKKTSGADFETTDSGSNVNNNNKLLDDIRQEFPPFEDNADQYPGLTEKSRKKLHYVENFLKLDEIVKFIADYNEKNPPKLFLKSSLRRFFQVFYKWLKHPHKRELNSSAETKLVLEEYLLAFDKINKGLNQRNKRFKKDKNGLDVGTTLSSSSGSDNFPGSKSQLSDDEEREWKCKGNERRKDEETEDGIVSTLPLKKRKATVQQVNAKTGASMEKNGSKSSRAESVSQTQNFLQDIDVDRFLSQIHGQENR